MKNESRLDRIEKNLCPKHRIENIMFLVAPEDYPDPLPPNYVRMSELKKRDLSDYRRVILLHIGPRDYEERKKAAELQKMPV
jgi:hypothetical protein